MAEQGEQAPQPQQRGQERGRQVTRAHIYTQTHMHTHTHTHTQAQERQAQAAGERLRPHTLPMTGNKWAARTCSRSHHASRGIVLSLPLFVRLIASLPFFLFLPLCFSASLPFCLSACLPSSLLASTHAAAALPPLLHQSCSGATSSSSTISPPVHICQLCVAPRAARWRMCGLYPLPRAKRRPRHSRANTQRATNKAVPEGRNSDGREKVCPALPESSL